MFKPDTPEREMRRILQASGTHLVGGPTVTDAYVLQAPPASTEQALLHLRAEPWVTMAQALAAEGAR
jgi:hypothetical protein